MRYLGIDFGTKRTGLAISDENGRMAVVKDTIIGCGQDEVVERIKETVVTDKVEVVVVGLPLGLNSQHTEMTAEVERFVEKLRAHLGVPVQTFDERLTTAMARKLLQGMKQEDRDKVAAQIMLQNFLDELAYRQAS